MAAYVAAPRGMEGNAVTTSRIFRTHNKKATLPGASKKWSSKLVQFWREFFQQLSGAKHRVDALRVATSFTVLNAFRHLRFIHQRVNILRLPRANPWFKPFKRFAPFHVHDLIPDSIPVPPTSTGNHRRSLQIGAGARSDYRNLLARRPVWDAPSSSAQRGAACGCREPAPARRATCGNDPRNTRREFCAVLRREYPVLSV